MKRYALLLLFLLPLSVFAQVDNPAAIPQWVLDDWNFWMKDGGVWIADNSAYQTKDEPFEAYGMEYKWGIGETSLTGRLYGIQEGLEVGDFWQFLLFWDPEKRESRMIQTGGGGMVGQGVITPEEVGHTKSIMRYMSPDGTNFTTGHETIMSGDQITTQSFDVVDGIWKKRRSYVWKTGNG